MSSDREREIRALLEEEGDDITREQAERIVDALGVVRNPITELQRLRARTTDPAERRVIDAQVNNLMSKLRNVITTARRGRSRSRSRSRSPTRGGARRTRRRAHSRKH